MNINTIMRAKKAYLQLNTIKYTVNLIKEPDNCKVTIIAL